MGLHGLKYWEHKQFSKAAAPTAHGDGGEEEEEDSSDEDDAQLFVDSAIENEPAFFQGNVFLETEAAIERVTGPNAASIQEDINAAFVEEAREGTEEDDDGDGQLIVEGGGLEEPLLENRRDLMKKTGGHSVGYFYETQYFDRVTLFGLRKHVKHEHRGILEETVTTDGFAEDFSDYDDGITPDQIYKAFVAMEEGGRKRKWYHCVWQSLPLQPIWDLSKITCQNNCTCCCREDAKFKKNSRCAKIWIVTTKTIGVCLNLLALYVAIVACGATLQIRWTKSKLPYVQEKLYNNMDEGQVCASNEKCGDIRTFDDAASAALSNYTVLHCGPCGYCSTWNDLELQWTTRHTLAEQSQECGRKTMFGGVDDLSQCLSTDIGFTHNCATCWAEDINCSKKYCIFIYLQSLMTNELGNFEVGPTTITSATCEEANCEAGNPGDFVECSGANRRRMDIKSAIARPDDQQCSIVGIPAGPDGPDWENFFDPSCPRDVSPPLYN